jgi:PII-like signaling protein
VNDDCLKISAYLGERDRQEGRFLADVLLDEFGRQELQTSILLRGTEGFGAKHRLQTQRLLSLSEDLPIVAVGVDTRARIEPLVERLRATLPDRLLTVERARMLSGSFGTVELPADLREATKLTIYCGRAERIDGHGEASLTIVDLLQEHGVAGATVFLGVDGTAHGSRERARFFSRNRKVPLMIVSVGSGETIAAVLPKLGGLLDRPLLTLERVRVLKRDGELLGEIGAYPDVDDERAGVWQKLMVYASEQAHVDGHPLYVELIRRLRGAGASGATAVRGIWGYHGDHAPHGDRLLSLRRHVPVVTIAVDRPSAVRQWWPIVDELTRDTGLVTSELVYERS